jgi:phosphoribosylglycinamide formyltransferase-1
MLNIAVLVSGNGTNLKAILDRKASGDLPSCNIKLILSSNPDAHALTYAQSYGISSSIVKKDKGISSDNYSDMLLSELITYHINFVVLAGFIPILSGHIINAYHNRIINVHPSLIPAFCGKGCYGLHIHQAVLDAGVKVTGATVHYVDATIDGGCIIAQKSVNVLPDDTAQTLRDRVMREAEWVLLPSVLEACCREALKCQSGI